MKGEIFLAEIILRSDLYNLFHIKLFHNYLSLFKISSIDKSPFSLLENRGKDRWDNIIFFSVFAGILVILFISYNLITAVKSYIIFYLFLNKTLRILMKFLLVIYKWFA